MLKIILLNASGNSRSFMIGCMNQDKETHKKISDNQFLPRIT